ncbi:hypothetical protein [Granulicella arctica]|uniref:hypothetical protein n=1 Tax=Granulicella arctica TaxID=940613 RepID=UPI0021E03B31|nr:hypothetical protein [Granulicella arctica]
MKNRSLSGLLFGKSQSNELPSTTSAPRKKSLGKYALCGLLIAVATLGLTACGPYYYKFPVFPFANRPIPPSKLAERVMISVGNVGAGGTGGALAIVDALRDIRSNVENTVTSFSISGFSSGSPLQIISFPEETRGYVYSSAGNGALNIVNYSTEAVTGSAGTFPAPSSSLAIPTDFVRYFSAEENTGQLVILDNSTAKAYALNLPNVYQVYANVGDTVALAMVRNSDTLYQTVKLNANQYLTAAAADLPASQGGIGAVDCQPLNLPVYCVVPVPGNYDRPIGAYFSLDGTTAYILNCGPECGGRVASVTLMAQGALNINNVATSTSIATAFIANVPVPGGVTTAISDGSTLYVAGQQLMPDGLFAGNLSTISLATNAITAKYSISDGNHTKLLFADDNTLWIGSQFCATGERAKLSQNYNCLTRFDLSAKTAAVLPAVTPGGTATVPFPNTNLNPYYYGDLTGICWVQTFHKVYTAYGGQVHVFNTATGAEIDNSLVTVQGTALDVAYLDAQTNGAN